MNVRSAVTRIASSYGPQESIVGTVGKFLHKVLVSDGFLHLE